MALGNQATATITVTVANSPPPQPPGPVVTCSGTIVGTALAFTCSEAMRQGAGRQLAYSCSPSPGCAWPLWRLSCLSATCGAAAAAGATCLGSQAASISRGSVPRGPVHIVVMDGDEPGKFSGLKRQFLILIDQPL